jgi:hypothetical protein
MRMTPQPALDGAVLAVHGQAAFSGSPCPSIAMVIEFVRATTGLFVEVSTVKSSIARLIADGRMVVRTSGGRRCVCVGGQWSAKTKSIVTAQAEPGLSRHRCLRCGVSFAPTHRGNHICPRCSHATTSDYLPEEHAMIGLRRAA